MLAFHVNCVQRRQFAWNVKSCFLEKKMSKNIINLSSAELATRVKHQLSDAVLVVAVVVSDVASVIIVLLANYIFSK